MTRLYIEAKSCKKFKKKVYCSTQKKQKIRFSKELLFKKKLKSNLKIFLFLPYKSF